MFEDLSQATEFSFSIRRGDTLDLLFELFDDEYNQPLDLTNHTMKMQIKTKVDGAILQEYSTANGKITFQGSPTLGGFRVRETAANTRNYVWSKGVYDIEFTKPNAEVVTYLCGQILLIKDITS